MTHKESRPARSLNETLDRIEGAGNGTSDVSLGIVVEALGARSFGPVILLAGIIVLAPVIGDIPGVPTIMGIIVIVAAAQQVAGRNHFWLPRKFLDRPVSTEKVHKATRLLRKPAGGIDKLLARRLEFLTTGFPLRVAGLACLLIGLVLPLMEFVPFSANLAGLALTLFGLGLIANDGILTAVAFVVVVVIGWVVLRSLL